MRGEHPEVRDPRLPEGHSEERPSFAGPWRESGQSEGRRKGADRSLKRARPAAFLAWRKTRPQAAKPSSVIAQVEASGTFATINKYEGPGSPDGPAMESTSVSEKGPSIGPEAATGDAGEFTKVTTLDGLAKSCDAQKFRFTERLVCGIVVDAPIERSERLKSAGN